MLICLLGTTVHISMRPIRFTVGAREGKARTGTLHTPHGDIQTPAFVPVGTMAGVKGVLPDALSSLGSQVVLANTYHLYLQPGEALVEEAGGVGSFMNWKGPTITDSGGFQVFSLGAGYNPPEVVREEDKNREVDGVTVFDEDVQTQHGKLAIIDEEGVTFTSHLDGSLHRFTPERSVEIQHALGADIFFAFDECTSPSAPFEYQKEAMYRTHRWADRSLKAHRQNISANNAQGIYGIAQGGQFEDLRRESTRAIADMGFDGFGLGGSFSKKYGESMLELVLRTLDELPEEMPRHGLGVGEPRDLLLGIAYGVDTFDCVSPTRHGRHGVLYTKDGQINLFNERWKQDFRTLGDVALAGTLPSGSEHFTLAYVAHLLRSNEMLGQIIASMHNLAFLTRLVDGARAAIEEGRFAAYQSAFMHQYYGA